MEFVIDISTFCNICFNKESLRKLEQFEHLTKILMILIENKILIKDQEIYLCLNCCEKLESYDNFKEMCFKNFIDFRVEYSALKKKLETYNDPNVEKKLRNFVESKVYGATETLKLYDSMNIVKTEDSVISVQKSEENLTEKLDERIDYNYNFYSVSCKIEYDEYKLHTELHLEDSENSFELPVPDKQIKVESFQEEDIGATESSSKNEALEQSKSFLNETDEVCSTTTELIQHNKSASLNETVSSTSKRISNIVCKICNKKLSNVGNLNKHIRIHTGEKLYTCTVCNKSFNEASSLKVHMTVHTKERLYLCNVCKKKFSTQSSLKIHKSIHTGVRPHVCKICNKGFSLSSRLKGHMLVHTDDKPHTCHICSKSFKRSLQLKQHERLHTGERPYACTMCDKTFNNSGTLKTHKLVHTEEGEYSCEICHKSFLYKSYFKRHVRIHTGEKPFECIECNERFADLRPCKIHKLVHAGEKPYSCNICKKTFSALNFLKDHKRTHTEVKLYSCDICKKSYRQKCYLNLHKLKRCVLNEENKISEQSEDANSNLHHTENVNTT